MKPFMLKGTTVFTEFRLDALLKSLQDALGVQGELSVESNYAYLLPEWLGQLQADPGREEPPEAMP